MKVTATVAANMQMQWGQRQTETRKYKIEETVRWDPGHWRCSIIATKGIVNVPFKLVYKTVSGGKRVTVGGLWKGVVCQDAKRKMKRLPPSKDDDED
jgi:hypothetical protein